MRHRLAPEADYYRLPLQSPPSPPPSAFMLCPSAIIPGCTDDHWASVQQTYEQAFAMLGVPGTTMLPEDDSFFWN